MVASTSANSRRPSDWIWIGCLAVLLLLTIGLTVHLIGSWVYSYWWPKTVPGAAQYDKGSVLMADGDLKGAIEAFQGAIDKNHHHALAVFYQAKAHQKLGESDSAIGGYTEALRLHKEIEEMKPSQREQLSPVPLGFERADAYFNLGTLLFQAGKPGEAIAYYNEALVLNPENADACCGRGEAYLATDDPTQALVDLNEAIRLLPNSYKAFCLCARAKLAAGRYDDAIDDARQAIHLNAQSGDAFLVLGTAILSSPDHQPAKAVKYLAEAIRLDKSLTGQANAERDGHISIWV